MEVISITREKVGECDVDTGMLMVGDPVNFVGNDSPINERCGSWDEACRDVFCEPGLGRIPVNVYGLGTAVVTTEGDGTFPVFIETTQDGRRRLVVELG